MKCPFCGYEDSKVLDSRPVGDGVSIRRRRECISCSGRFTTYERYEDNKILVVKKDGKREQFDSKKVMNGIIKACEKRPVTYEQIEDMVAKIEDKLRKSGKIEVQSKDIGDMIMEKLKIADQVAYVSFASVYREFRDIDQFLAVIRELKN